MKLTRRRFLQVLGGTGLAGAGIYGYASQIAPHRLVLEHVRIGVQGLAAEREGCRIAVLSDLHAGPRVSMRHIERALQMAADAEPEFLVILGDIVDSTTSHLEELCRVLAPITARIPTYGVTGNHDFSNNIENPTLFARRVCGALRDAGVRMLRNTSHQPREGKGELCFVGVDDFRMLPLDERAFTRVPRDAAVVLLVHNPDIYEHVEKHRWDLMLAGHTHGGQVRIPGIGPLILPISHRERAAGLIYPDTARPDRVLYVNRGVGHLLKVRFFCPPEVTCVTLERRGGG
ncbi:MAG: metallophosphoesterase [Phycisphaerales bacterium]|nr:metallophosphoesterase [Phycisphaerales bacterium]